MMGGAIIVLAVAFGKKPARQQPVTIDTTRVLPGLA